MGSPFRGRLAAHLPAGLSVALIALVGLLFAGSGPARGILYVEGLDRWIARNWFLGHRFFHMDGVFLPFVLGFLLRRIRAWPASLSEGGFFGRWALIVGLALFPFSFALAIPPGLIKGGSLVLMAAFLAVTAGGVLAIGWLIGFRDERVPVAVACALPGVGIAGAAGGRGIWNQSESVVQWMVLSLYVVGIVNALAVLGISAWLNIGSAGHGVWLGISAAGLGPLRAVALLIDPGSPDGISTALAAGEEVYRLRILGFPFLVLLLAIVLLVWRTGPWEKGGRWGLLAVAIGGGAASVLVLNEGKVPLTLADWLSWIGRFLLAAGMFHLGLLPARLSWRREGRYVAGLVALSGVAALCVGLAAGAVLSRSLTP